MPGIFCVRTEFSLKRKEGVIVEVKISTTGDFYRRNEALHAEKKEALVVLFIQDNGASYLTPVPLLGKHRNKPTENKGLRFVSTIRWFCNF